MVTTYDRVSPSRFSRVLTAEGRRSSTAAMSSIDSPDSKRVTNRCSSDDDHGSYARGWDTRTCRIWPDPGAGSASGLLGVRVPIAKASELLGDVDLGSTRDSERWSRPGRRILLIAVCAIWPTRSPDTLSSAPICRKVGQYPSSTPKLCRSPRTARLRNVSRTVPLLLLGPPPVVGRVPQGGRCWRTHD